MAFRLKLFELCRTRTKKSTRDIFNFFVVLTGHDIVTATTVTRKFKATLLQTKSTKKEEPSENMGSVENPLEELRRKNYIKQ